MLSSPSPFPLPPLFTFLLPSSIHPGGTLLARELLPPSFSFSCSLHLRQTQRRETGTTADSASLLTRTHTQKSSPFVKFSIITVPPWFVPITPSPSFPFSSPRTFLAPYLPPPIPDRVLYQYVTVPASFLFVLFLPISFFLLIGFFTTVSLNVLLFFSFHPRQQCSSRSTFHLQTGQLSHNLFALTETGEDFG